MGLGESIKYHRLRANMSQADLAKRLYIHKVTLSGYERNAHNPTKEMVTAIARTLGISTQAIYADAINEFPDVSGKDWRTQNLVYPDVEILKRARLNLDLSQYELAKRAGVSPQTVKQIEEGRPVYNYTWEAIKQVLCNDPFTKNRTSSVSK